MPFVLNSLFPFIGSSYIKVCIGLFFNIQELVFWGEMLQISTTQLASSMDPLSEHCYLENHFIYQNNFNLLSK